MFILISTRRWTATFYYPSPRAVIRRRLRAEHAGQLVSRPAFEGGTWTALLGGLTGAIAGLSSP